MNPTAADLCVVANSPSNAACTLHRLLAIWIPQEQVAAVESRRSGGGKERRRQAEREKGRGGSVGEAERRGREEGDGGEQEREGEVGFGVAGGGQQKIVSGSF